MLDSVFVNTDVVSMPVSKNEISEENLLEIHGGVEILLTWANFGFEHNQVKV